MPYPLNTRSRLFAWHKLDFPCMHEGCTARADVEFELSCQDLPEIDPETKLPFLREGSRSETYCLAHIPDPLRKIWDKQTNINNWLNVL